MVIRRLIKSYWDNKVWV